MSRFALSATPLSGLTVVQRQPIGDSRGCFARLFCSGDLAAAGWDRPIAQINHSATSHRGTVRGLHYQLPPQAEQKLVSCLRGEVWDVAVDLRRDSPTFLAWHAVRLSADNHQALLIPEGFAHGFQTLSDEVELLYCHSAPYAAAAERGIPACDPLLDIAWPLAITELSSRDQAHPALERDWKGLSL
jgi:dTDP-4-dehydrorhamnose 3,5-epimerase